MDHNSKHPRRSPLEAVEEVDLARPRTGRGSGRSSHAAGPPAPDANPVRVLGSAAVFLVVALLLQVRATRRDEAGPLDRLAGALLPRLPAGGLGGGRAGEANRTAAGVCPPDRYLDEAFAEGRPGDGALYAAEHDPRVQVAAGPSMYSRCALRRWVRLEEEHACAEGREYVTVLEPPPAEGRSEGGKIPPILHLSSPTNCLPAATVGALRDLHRRPGAPAFAVYVHSHQAMENFLFQREWSTFPQMKEGALCGAGKLAALARRVLDLLEIGSSTAQREGIAREVARGPARDLWRLAVLWEYGGVAADVAVLQAVLAEGEHRGDGSFALRSLADQWYGEEHDALLYFVNNDHSVRPPPSFDKRVAFTDIMGAAPHHPLMYYGAKIATRIATGDLEIAISERGRTTKLPPIEEALNRFNWWWKKIRTGDVLHLPHHKNSSIHFVDADGLLPPSLASARTSPWRSIFAAFRASGAENVPADESISRGLVTFAAEQRSAPGLFSCMEATLDMYSQRTTSKH